MLENVLVQEDYCLIMSLIFLLLCQYFSAESGSIITIVPLRERIRNFRKTNNGSNHTVAITRVNPAG